MDYVEINGKMILFFLVAFPLIVPANLHKPILSVIFAILTDNSSFL